MTLSCRDVTQLVSEGLDRELPPAEQARLRAHFAICRGCRSVRERLQFLRRAMQSFASRESDGKR